MVRPPEPCPACGRPLGPAALIGVRDLEHGLGEPVDFAECGGCGTLARTPRPTAEELLRHYPVDYRPHAADGAAGRLMRLRARLLLRRLLPYLPSPESNPRLADVACGGGHLLAALAGAGYRRLVGVDAEPSVELAVRAAGAEFVAGALEGPLELGAPCDAILLSFALEHSAEPVRALRAARERLAPGGRLVVLTPNAASVARRVFGRAWSGLHAPRHSAVFTAAGLEAAAKTAGFTRAELTTLPDPGSWAVSSVSALGARSGGAPWPLLPLLPPAQLAAWAERALGRGSTLLAALG